MSHPEKDKSKQQGRKGQGQSKEEPRSSKPADEGREKSDKKQAPRKGGKQRD